MIIISELGRILTIQLFNIFIINTQIPSHFIHNETYTTKITSLFLFKNLFQEIFNIKMKLCYKYITNNVFELEIQHIGNKIAEFKSSVKYFSWKIQK